MDFNDPMKGSKSGQFSTVLTGGIAAPLGNRASSASGHAFSSGYTSLFEKDYSDRDKAADLATAGLYGIGKSLFGRRRDYRPPPPPGTAVARDYQAYTPMNAQAVAGSIGLNPAAATPAADPTIGNYNPFKSAPSGRPGDIAKREAEAKAASKATEAPLGI
jgi:hypothetical protein